MKFTPRKMYQDYASSRGKIKSKIMDTQEVDGSWEAKKGKLKQRFAELTQDDLIFAGGNIEELYARQQIKLSKTKAEFQKIIKSL